MLFQTCEKSLCSGRSQIDNWTPVVTKSPTGFSQHSSNPTNLSSQPPSTRLVWVDILKTKANLTVKFVQTSYRNKSRCFTVRIELVAQSHPVLNYEDKNNDSLAPVITFSTSLKIYFYSKTKVQYGIFSKTGCFDESMPCQRRF